jgi:hypothetical protein
MYGKHYLSTCYCDSSNVLFGGNQTQWACSVGSRFSRTLIGRKTQGGIHESSVLSGVHLQDLWLEITAVEAK